MVGLDKEFYVNKAISDNKHILRLTIMLLTINYLTILL